MNQPTKITGDNHEFILNEKSEKMIIIFTGTGAKKGHFFFYGSAQKLNINVLFINNGENEWYQNGIPSLGTKSVEETVTVINKWIDYLQIKDVYTCGASMGAYGAILYGYYLDTRVLAFGPELSLKIEATRSSSFIKSDTLINFDIQELMKLAGKEILIYVGEDDPIDIYQASKITYNQDEFPLVKVCSVYGAEHSVGAFLKAQNKLEDFLTHFILDKPMPALKESGISCTIKDFGIYYYQQYKFFKLRNWSDSLEYGKTSVSKNAINSFAQYMLGMCYIHLGKYEKGLLYLSTARSLAPGRLDYQFGVANCLRRMEHWEQAIDLHLKILKQDDNFAHSHYDLSLIYSKLNDNKRALTRAKYALKLQPNNKSFQKRVTKLTGNT